MIQEYNAIRMPQDLCGEWLLREDPEGNALFFQNPGPDSAWRKVTIPSDIATAIPERPYVSGIFWYRRNITVPESYAGRRVMLHFDAVNYEATVFIGGKFAGRNCQGFLPFSLDITNLVVPGCETEVCVRVNTRRRQGQMPTSFFWKNCSGILRDVCLYTTEESYIEDAYIRADHTGHGVFIADIVAKETDLLLALTVFDNERKEIFSSTSYIKDSNFLQEIDIDDIIPWSMDHPVLYEAEFTLLKGQNVIDVRRISFGYRTIEARSGKLFLNGEEIFLRGFNRHEDHPISGGAANAAVVESDFAEMKAAGANFVRMCHYPHDVRELDVADRLGLALLVEIPLCGYSGASGYHGATIEIDGSDRDAVNEEVYANARECLERMIRRDRNHPCVLIWSVSNENEEPDEFVIRNQDALIRIAKQMDPTRLASHVSNHTRRKGRETFFREDDVVCFNTYRTILGRISNKNRDFDPNEAGDALAEMVEDLRKDFPEKPIIVTEFGYRTCDSFDGPDDQDIQASAVAAEYKGARRSANGASVWIFADHLWPERNGCAGNVSEYGLLRRDRTKKKAFEAYSELLKKG